MYGRAARLGLLVGLLMGAGSCTHREPGDQPPDPDDTAQLTLALVSAPIEVGCVVIHLAGDVVTDRTVNLTGGVSSFTLSRLPVGVTVITVDAFADCAAAAVPGAAPIWIGGPVTVTLHPGHNGAPPPIPMRRAGRLSVELDFSGASTPAPICAAEKAACTTDANCCSERCVVPATSETRIGTCEAPLAPPLPSVALEFVGETQYLLYPLDGATSCPRTAGDLYTVTVQPGQQACLESPTFDGAAVVKLASVQICQAGNSCSECQEAECRPGSCFPQLTPIPADAACAGQVLSSEGQDTRYLIARTQLRTSSRTALPQFFQAGLTQTVTMSPPAEHSSFAVARLGRRVLPDTEGGGGSCGTSSLCGVLDFQQFAALPGWRFQFVPEKLSYAPAY
jgi:hypothetical protein